MLGCAVLLCLLAIVPFWSTDAALGPACLAALCAAASWFVERHRAPLENVRRIDRAEAFDGALSTAWELAARSSGLALEPLLIDRVRARFDARRASALLRPSPWPVLGVLAIAFGFYHQRSLDYVIEDGGSSPSAALAFALERIAAEPDSAKATGVAPVRIAALSRELFENPRTALEADNEFASDLARLEAALRSQPSVPREQGPAHGALAAIDELRARGEFAPFVPRAPATAAGLAAVSSPGTRANAGSGQGLTGSGGDGTMSGSAPTTMSSTIDTSGATAPLMLPEVEHGLASGGRASGDYDLLIERWEAILDRQREREARKPK